MAQVAAVRLTYNPKTLWFSPNGVKFRRGDNLIVKTERGLEFGRAEEDLKEVDEESIAALKTPLKPVVRVATADDEVAWKAMQRKAEEALPVFKQMVAEQGLDMHPVTVEYLFDGDKAIFYFESEERIDFRDLVRMLAARFHVRIDMRQIGVRDEARIVGGLGHCGQELCCKRLGGEFNPVTIRMAKDQDLSLNPQKISGVCGRLMCCLRYEADIYKEFKTRSPKMNSMIETPKGDAKVVEVNVPRETVTLLTSDDKRVKVPLSEMDVDKKTGKPFRVPADVFEDCLNETLSVGSSAETLVTSIFTGTDALAPAEGSRRSGSNSTSGSDSSSRKPRRRKRSGRSHEATGARDDSAVQGQSKQGQSKTQAKEKQQDKGQRSSKAQSGDSSREQQGANGAQRSSRRRRQVVSGGAGAVDARKPDVKSDVRSDDSSAKQAKQPRKRQQSRKETGSGSAAPMQQRQNGEPKRTSQHGDASENRPPKTQGQRKDGARRPGQRSSSLSSGSSGQRPQRSASGGKQQSPSKKEQKGNQGQLSGGNSSQTQNQRASVRQDAVSGSDHRKSRRRSHKAQGGESE